MSSAYVEVLNLETGKRGRIRRKLFDSPVFNPGILEEVDASQKPYSPLTFKSRYTPEEVDTDEITDDITNEEEV